MITIDMVSFIAGAFVASGVVGMLVHSWDKYNRE